jgi:hypothetical protein
MPDRDVVDLGPLILQRKLRIVLCDKLRKGVLMYVQINEVGMKWG